jgi:hypothetical protein
MYPVEEDTEKTEEQIEDERNRNEFDARIVKRAEDEFKAAIAMIENAKTEAPEVEFPKEWRVVYPPSFFTDLANRMSSYARDVAEGKPLVPEFKGIKDKIGPAIARAAKLAKQAEEAQREVDELQGRLIQLPVLIKSSADAIEQSLAKVLAWQPGVQNVLEQLRRY